MNLKWDFLLFSFPLSFPSRVQVNALTHLPNPTAGQAWWENGFPDGSEFQTGLNFFSPSAFTVFYLHSIQLLSEQRVIVFSFSFFFVAIPDSFVLSWLHYKMIIICECSDPVNIAWCDWSRWKVISAPGSMDWVAPGSDSWKLLLELLMLIT